MKNLQIFFLAAFMLLLAVPSAFAQDNTSACSGEVNNFEANVSQLFNCTSEVLSTFSFKVSCPGYWVSKTFKLDPVSLEYSVEVAEEEYPITTINQDLQLDNTSYLQGGFYKTVFFTPNGNSIGEEYFDIDNSETDNDEIFFAITQKDTCGLGTGIVSIFGFTLDTDLTLYGVGAVGNVISELTAGEYHLMAEVAGQCPSYHTFDMPSEGVDSHAEDGAPASCGDSGSLFVYIESGVPPYNFQVEDNGGNIFEIANVVNTTQVIDGLAAGNYTITISDSDGCAVTLEESVDCECDAATLVEVFVVEGTDGEDCDEIFTRVESFGCLGDTISIKLISEYVPSFAVESFVINDGAPIINTFSQGMPSGDYILEVSNQRSGEIISQTLKNYAGCGCDDFLVEATVIDPYGESDCQAIEYEINTCVPNEQVVLQLIPYDTENTQFETTRVTNSDGTLTGSFVPWGMIPSVSPFVRLKVTLPNGEYSVSNGIGYPGCTLTSTTDVENENRVNIYPNPASNSIRVNVGNFNGTCTYQIYTVDGKKIQSGKFALNNEDIDISSFPSGYFLIQFKDDKGIQLGTNRFIKQ